MELYIHIPFCIKKCDYCDFLSFPGHEEGQEIYCNALISEITHVEEGKNQEITSVFIGGGTPSVLQPNHLERIWTSVENTFSLTPDCEITIETNPGTLTREKVKMYHDLGINRISMGCQATHEEELRSLGRIHTYEEFLESYDMVRNAGFTNVNVDLMSAIPGQTMKDWEENLRRIIGLQPTHISAYSLIVEEGTPFYGRNLDLPDEDTERQMYELTGHLLQDAGYDRYEISNYAKPGYRCRHNEGYWRRDAYLGIGLGSASLVANCRYSNTRDLKEYIKLSGMPMRIRKDIVQLSREEQMEEFMFLGLRMLEGVNRRDFCREFGKPIEEVYGHAIEKMVKAKLLQTRGDQVYLTEKGISLSNQVFVEFMF